MSNPYSTPQADMMGKTDESALLSKSASLSAIAKTTFLEWEKLRVLFVLILGLVTLLLAGRTLAEFRMLVMVAEGAIVANVCYFAGPVTETYVRWLGYEQRWVRWFLFIGGTLLTSMLAVGCLATMLLPDQE